MDSPNILFVLLDQCRPDVLGRATPNVNALARRGARFEHCYAASPLCQPSRASIVTGRFPTHHGVCGNMNEPIGAGERADTFMQHLKSCGYHTALIGKHHYIDSYNLNVDSTRDDDELKDYGFDHVWQVADDGENLHNEDRFTHHLSRQGRLDEYRRIQKERAWGLGEFPYEPGESVDGYIGERAVEYIRDYAGDEPLYLNVGFVGPHPPYWTPKPYDAMFSPEEMAAPLGVEDPVEIERVRRIRAHYWGKVALIDHYVGQLAEALDGKGMLENTLIVFTADHGDMLGDFGIMDKRFFREPSVSVPLVMAGPGVEFNPRVGATVCKALVSGVDLYPTFLQAAGSDSPHGELWRDGRSLLDIAAERAERRTAVYSELGAQMMVRDADWKLVYDAEGGGVEQLFNLRHDPQELDNLAGIPAYQGVETGLVEKLLTRLICMTHHTHDKERARLQRVRV